ncbi:hypothetical protein LINPERPRIM_LOCUS8685 [Linum perenne]
MGEWISAAGRSAVSLNRGVVWVLARGIPVHLRSVDLFRTIGDLCGIFLGFEDAGDLNSIRLKIQVKKDFPKAVSLVFQSQEFEVSLFPEASDLELRLAQLPLAGGF